MKVLIRLACGTFCLGLVLTLWSQSTNQAPRAVVHPERDGGFLLVESHDFRETMFDRDVIEDRARRGMVLFVDSSYLENAPAKEYAATNWLTVSNALEQLHRLDRESSKPQIRVIQKDCILQSPYYAGPKSFEPWFLQRELSPGDIIVVSMLR